MLTLLLPLTSPAQQPEAAEPDASAEPAAPEQPAEVPAEVLWFGVGDDVSAACRFEPREEPQAFDPQFPTAAVRQRLGALARCLRDGPLAGRTIELRIHDQLPPEGAYTDAEPVQDPVADWLVRRGVPEAQVRTRWVGPAAVAEVTNEGIRFRRLVNIELSEEAAPPARPDET